MMHSERYLQFMDVCHTRNPRAPNNLSEKCHAYDLLMEMEFVASDGFPSCTETGTQSLKFEGGFDFVETRDVPEYQIGTFRE